MEGRIMLPVKYFPEKKEILDSKEMLIAKIRGYNHFRELSGGKDLRDMFGLAIENLFNGKNEKSKFRHYIKGQAYGYSPTLGNVIISNDGDIILEMNKDLPLQYIKQIHLYLNQEIRRNNGKQGID